jgi:hypothetical protein
MTDWILVEHRARGSWDTTAALVDTLDLRSGLSIQAGAWRGASLGMLPSILPTKNTDSVETYVRGTDLVTTHPATVERPTRVQLYWRRWHDVPQEAAAVCELVVSVQTHLLDSDPTLVIESRFVGAQDLLQLDGASEVNLGGNQAIILTHPNDAAETELIRGSNSNPGFVVRNTLFRQRLEKGVILRGRLLFAWSEQKLSAAAREALSARFIHAEPVLTT